MPINDPKIKIRSLISEGQELYNKYYQTKNQFENSKVFGGILKELGSNYIKNNFDIPKKYVKGIKLSTPVTWEMSNQHQDLMTDYQSWFLKCKELIKTTSEWNKRLRYPGNSKRLLIKFNKLDKKVRLDTKIKTGIAVLTDIHRRELIYTSELPKKKIKPKIPAKLKKEKTSAIEDLIQQGTLIIYKLETRLRVFIEETLRQQYGKKWLKLGVPKDIIDKCKKRMKANESPFKLPRSSKLLDYANFSDYRKIILRRDNWKNIFQKYFHNQKNMIETYFIQMEDIRNSIQHNRSNIDDRAILKLQVFSDDILNAINRIV